MMDGGENEEIGMGALHCGGIFSFRCWKMEIRRRISAVRGFVNSSDWS